MNKKKLFSIIALVGLIIVIAFKITGFTKNQTPNDEILSYKADPKLQHINFYWKNDSLKNFGSILNLNECPFIYL